MSRLIAFSGKKESGKSTSAKRVEKWGYQPMSFAQPIKQICMDYFDLSQEDVYGSKKEVVHLQWGTTPRKIMQFVGTDLFREKLGDLIGGDLAGNFWINRFKKDYEEVVCQLTLTRTYTQVETGVVSIGSPDHPSGDRHLSKAQVELGYKKANIVVDDVRFENEAQAIRDLGGKLIKIKRTNQFSTVADDHVSEQELDDSLFDHVIINDGTLEELENKIDDLFN
jgi:hypothetical protein